MPLLSWNSSHTYWMPVLNLEYYILNYLIPRLLPALPPRLSNISNLLKSCEWKCLQTFDIYIKIHICDYYIWVYNHLIHIITSIKGGKTFQYIMKLATAATSTRNTLFDFRELSYLIATLTEHLVIFFFCPELD